MLTIMALVLTLFVNEELIRLLLLHNQVFATDYNQIVLALRHLHADDLVGLPGRSLKQRNVNFTGVYCLKVVYVVEQNLVNL